MKTLVEVKNESTCQKRVTVCEIYDKENNLLSRESNRCSPINGICSRLDITQNKSNYDVISTCNWTHTEINSIKSILDGGKPYRAVLHGHTFYCDNCENELKKIGVQILEIIK